MFWSDNWTSQLLKTQFPELFSFTRKPKCSISYFLNQEDDRLISLPLSQLAAAQFQEIQNLIQWRNWDENGNDTWTYNWGSPRFSSKKAYGALVGNTAASPLFRWLWASSNLGQHKFFFLLLLRDRLNTRNLLRRKNMHLDSYHYVLCNLNCEETCFHLFFECPFSRDCWSTIPINWNLNVRALDMILQARENFGNANFREIVITACWIIWTTRNGVIFDNG